MSPHLHPRPQPCAQPARQGTGLWREGIKVSQDVYSPKVCWRPLSCHPVGRWLLGAPSLRGPIRPLPDTDLTSARWPVREVTTPPRPRVAGSLRPPRPWPSARHSTRNPHGPRRRWRKWVGLWGRDGGLRVLADLRAGLTRGGAAALNLPTPQQTCLHPRVGPESAGGQAPTSPLHRGHRQTQLGGSGQGRGRARRSVTS